MLFDSNREAPWRELHRRLAGGTPPNTDRTVVPLPTRSGTQPRPEPVGTGWAELHVHSSYSFLDGPSDPAPAPRQPPVLRGASRITAGVA